jgi:propionate CoA-transferase
MFRHYRDHLDAALLGFLEFDAQGHVNVSRRGDAVTDYVGPGGFPSITHAARSVIFIGRWMHGAAWRIDNETLVLAKRGRPKLVPAVAEITFNGREALADGKQVLYVTTVGIFRLTRDGLLLETLMPGIDLDRDVRSAVDVPVRLPPGGPEVAPTSIVSGRGFDLGALAAPAAAPHAMVSQGVLP